MLRTLLIVLALVLASAPAARASCFNPAGNAGDLRYNGGYGVYQYCNGGAWIGIGHVSNLTGGLAGWWKFDETSGTSAADSSGNGQTATLLGTETFIAGLLNNAVSINTLGANHQDIQVSSHAHLDDLSTVTVSFWINLSVLPASGKESDIADKGTGSAGWTVSIMPDGSVRLYVFNGTTTMARQSSAGGIATGAWYHVAVTWTSNITAANSHIYLNGAETTYQTTTNGAGTHLTDAAQLLETGGCCAGNYMNGLVDDMRVYSRALSAADIKTLYTSTGGMSGDINTGLKGYWKFDEGSGTSAADSSGQGNAGNLVNTPTWTSSGKIKGALTFNGTSQYVNVPYNAILNFTSSFTVSAWVNATALGGTQTIMDNNPATSDGNLILQFNNNNLAFGFFDTANFARLVTTATTYSNNVWYHVAGVFDATAQTMGIYVNGTLAISQAAPWTPHSNTNPHTIGESSWGGQYFGGTIDDVHVYSRALSDSDVLTLYNSTATACASPVGYAGDEIYNNGANHVPQYCNGASWIKMGKVPGAGGAGCSNPAGSEGDTIYNKDYYALQYCDGTNWVVMGTRTLTGLVGWWNLDEGSGTSAADSSGNGNTGTLINSPTWTTSGKFNGALQFITASNQYVDVGNASTLNFERTQPFSLAAWIYVVNPGCCPYEEIIAKRDTGTFQGIDFQDDLGNNTLVATLYAADTTQISVATSINSLSPLSTWYHVAMTYDGSSTAAGVKMYINGVNQTPAVGSDNLDASILTSTHMQVGARENTAGFNGTIDDARVYNRVLSAGEIAHLYNGAP